MASFKDHTGVEWDIELLFGHVKPLRDKHGLDTKTTPQKFFEQLNELVHDAERLYLLLLMVCARQIKERGLDEEQFAYVLGTNAILEARTAVVESFVNFAPAPIFKGPKTASEIARALDTATAAWDDKASQAVKEKIPSLISSALAGSSPPSPASTIPGPSPSENSSGRPTPDGATSGSGPVT